MKRISLFVCVCGRSTVRLQVKRSDLLVFVRHLRQEKDPVGIPVGVHRNSSDTDTIRSDPVGLCRNPRCRNPVGSGRKWIRRNPIGFRRLPTVGFWSETIGSDIQPITHANSIQPSN